MKSLISVIVLGMVTAACPVKHASQDNPSAALAVAWNALIMDTAVAEDGLLTLKGVRTAAMVHLAMHDVLSNLDGRYAPYNYTAPGMDADPLAAANQAAFLVAIDQYPDQHTAFDAERSKWMQAAGKGATQASVDLGTKAAQAILGHRKNDASLRCALPSCLHPF